MSSPSSSVSQLHYDITETVQPTFLPWWFSFPLKPSITLCPSWCPPPAPPPRMFGRRHSPSRVTVGEHNDCGIDSLQPALVSVQFISSPAFEWLARGEWKCVEPLTQLQLWVDHGAIRVRAVQNRSYHKKKERNSAKRERQTSEKLMEIETSDDQKECFFYNMFPG